MSLVWRSQTIMSRLQRCLFPVVSIIALSLVCYIYSAGYNTRRDQSKLKIYLQTENNSYSIQPIEEKNTGLSTKGVNTNGSFSKAINTNGSYSKPINTNGSFPSSNTMHDAAHENFLKLVNGITSNHPGSAEDLWIEIDLKNTLIRRTVFFDNRTSISPAIVIILLHKKSKKPEPNLFAKITMPDGTKWCQETQNIYTFNPQAHREEFRHGPDNYMSIVKKLALTKNTEMPNYIELSTNKRCTDLLPAMPIYYEKYEKRVKFALCVQKGLFGYVSPEMLIHFVEINKVLGASIITLWIQNTTESVYTAMLPYIKSGLVEVLDWKISVPMRNYGQYAVNNECLYRNIHRADYLVLHDIDELIIPYKHDTWDELLAYYSNKINLSHYASLRFKSLAWKVVNNGNYSFLSNISSKSSATEIPWKMACSKMNIPYYFEANERFKHPVEIRHKVIASLNTTIAISTHRVKKVAQGVINEYDVPPDISLSHHYRIPPLDGTYVQSTFMKKFVNKVMPGIEKQVC